MQFKIYVLFAPLLTNLGGLSDWIKVNHEHTELIFLRVSSFYGGIFGGFLFVFLCVTQLQQCHSSCWETNLKKKYHNFVFIRNVTIIKICTSPSKYYFYADNVIVNFV
jgi:hypothetical protein